MKISDLVPDPKNANRGTKRGNAVTRTSLEKFGAGRSIVIDRDNRIIAGNHVVKNAPAAGINDAVIVDSDGAKLIVVRRTDLSLDDDKARQLALADNRTSELGLEWDPDVLAEFAAADLDLQPFFTEQELVDLGAVAAHTFKPDDDEAPEVPVEPVTKPGDLYILGNHRLLCGNATNASDVDRLLDGRQADLIFTDPPYGISFQSGMSNRFDVLANDDKMLDIAPFIWSIMADDTAAFIWTSHQVYPEWRRQFSEFYKQTIIWYKHGGGMGDLTSAYACDFEMCLFCVKGRPEFRGNRGMAVWDISKDGASTYEHPTQKPVALAVQAITDFSDPGDTVVDLFGGSGSTLIACEKSNRSCYMMELDPKYVDVIVRRWENATGDKAVLVTDSIEAAA